MSQDPITLQPEAALRVRHGLAAKTLAAIRHQHFQEGVHWEKKGREVCYTEAGCRALEGLLAEQEGIAPPDPDPPEPVRLVAFKTRLANSRILLAKKEGAAPEDPPVRVRVRSSARFRPGMVLATCVALDEAAGLFEYRGKMPRFQGRW